MTAELQKARKTIARQRGQLTGLSESLMRERAENAKLRDHIFKLEMERDETEEERRDDAASELEERVALMTLNPRGAAATRGRRCGRCGNRSRAANWRDGRGRGRGRGSTAASSVGIDAPQGTNVNISLRY